LARGGPGLDGRGGEVQPDEKVSVVGNSATTWEGEGCAIFKLGGGRRGNELFEKGKKTWFSGRLESTVKTSGEKSEGGLQWAVEGGEAERIFRYT